VTTLFIDIRIASCEILKQKIKLLNTLKNLNMSNLRNNVRLIGNLGMNPDVKELNGGKKLAKFSIATSETYKGEDGNKVTETQWHNLTVWGKQADVVEKYLKKGNEVAIEGKLSSRTYTDKEGIKRYVTEIIVNDLLLIGGKKDK
jgi:single-strand DNA-binding protein